MKYVLQLQLANRAKIFRSFISDQNLFSRTSFKLPFLEQVSNYYYMLTHNNIKLMTDKTFLKVLNR